MQNGTPTSIYKYFDEYGVLIYVGITNGGIRRQREHNKDKSWWQYVASQTVEHHESRGVALEREAELICTHQPPFNTQHNPRHKAAQASYQAFRKLPELDKSPLEIVKDAAKEIPLMPVHHEGNSLILGTPARFAPLVPLMTMDKNVKAVSGTIRCGTLVSTRARGASLEIIMNVRKGSKVKDPFMRLSIVLAKGGATFKARSIQLSPDDPAPRPAALIDLQDEATV